MDFKIFGGGGSGGKFFNPYGVFCKGDLKVSELLGPYCEMVGKSYELSYEVRIMSCEL